MNEPTPTAELLKGDLARHFPICLRHSAGGPGAVFSGP
jgi:hypothetical protein